VALKFSYDSHHPLRRNKLASLPIREASWSEAVNAGSTFTGKITLPSDPLQASRIIAGTTPDQAALYVSSGPGSYTWGGPIKSRTWDSKTNTFTITAMEWRSWLYQLIYGPDPAGTTTSVRNYVGVDQVTIARNILLYSLAGGISAGAPVMSLGTIGNTGVLRNYTLQGSQLRSAGSYLDEIGGFDNGFEWDIEIEIAADGLPRPKFAAYYPQRGGVVPGLLFKLGSTMTSYDEVTESTLATYTRVWAVGDGPNAESTPYAMDQDPGISSGQGFVLRSDKVSSYTNVTRTQLASLARSERTASGVSVTALGFNARLDSPNINSYQVGDRCRVILKDRYLNLDVSKVRIIQRDIDPDNNNVKITVNLSDLVAPEVDPGGSV
jgi:hypothetical protein